MEEGANKTGAKQGVINPGMCITKPNSIQGIKLKKPLTMDEYNANSDKPLTSKDTCRKDGFPIRRMAR